MSRPLVEERPEGSAITFSLCLPNSHRPQGHSFSSLRATLAGRLQAASFVSSSNQGVPNAAKVTVEVYRGARSRVSGGSRRAAGSAQAKNDKQPDVMGDDIGWENLGAYHQGLLQRPTPKM